MTEAILEEVKDIAEKFNDFLISFYTAKDYEGYIHFFNTVKLKNSPGSKILPSPLLLPTPPL